MSEKAALMVVDVQRLYMEPEPMVTSDGDDLIPKCRRLIDKARAAGAPVVFIQHVGDDQPDDPDLVGVHPDLAPETEEPVIRKTFGSAFLETELEETLRELAVTSLTICGLATFACVNATVLCAICKGYGVTVVRDAHGARDFPGATAAAVIEGHNATWARAGAKLVSERETTFGSSA